MLFAPFSLRNPRDSTQPHTGRVLSRSRSGLSFLEYYTLATKPVNVADAILASARFPYVTPARTLNEGAPIKGLPSLKLTDGGFFDNSGSFAASEIMTAVRADVNYAALGVEFYFVRLLIDELGSSTSVPDAWSEFLMPMQTLNNTRSIHQAAFDQASKAAVASEATSLICDYCFNRTQRCH